MDARSAPYAVCTCIAYVVANSAAVVPKWASREVSSGGRKHAALPGLPVMLASLWITETGACHSREDFLRKEQYPWPPHRRPRATSGSVVHSVVEAQREVEAMVA